MKYILFILLLAVLLINSACQPEKPTPVFQSQLIFPLQEKHVHGSTVVELPNGDLLASWFEGTGERWADDVFINGARLKKGDTVWSKPFVLADVDGFPDINPIMFLDKQQQLWLMWYPVLANQWETSLPMYRTSNDYTQPGAPKWAWQDVLFIKVGDNAGRGIQSEDSFVLQVQRQLSEYEQYLNNTVLPRLPDSIKKEYGKQWPLYKAKADSIARGLNFVRKGIAASNGVETHLGYPLTRRIGWQTKNKAIFAGNRMIVPLYSDGLDCSLFALTDDGGAHWMFSNPILGGSGIQPTIFIGKDSTLTAYLRDNGLAPQRMQKAVSYNKGLTWSIAKNDSLPNPGAGFDGVTLSTGEWLMVYNDSEDNRHNLAVALSDDEGATWKWKKYIENDIRKDSATVNHYPAIIEGKDKRIHITYSFHRKDGEPAKTVKHVSFTRSWLIQSTAN